MRLRGVRGWVVVATLAGGCQTSTVTTRSSPGGGNGTGGGWVTTTAGAAGDPTPAGAARAAPPPPAADPDAPVVPTASAGGRVMSIDEAFGGDPVVRRIEAVQEALLTYYHGHRQLPGTLDELRSPAGEKLELTSASGRPFAYDRLGLSIPSSVGKRVIVYDPAPGPDGGRWCLVMPRSPATGAAVAMEVVDVPENVFRTFEQAP